MTGLLSPMHLVIILIVGFLLFGKRLPEMGRSLGKGLVEFKKSFSGLEDDTHATNSGRPEQTPAEIRPPQRITAAAPKFEDNSANAAAVTPPPRV